MFIETTPEVAAVLAESIRRERADRERVMRVSRYGDDHINAVLAQYDEQHATFLYWYEHGTLPPVSVSHRAPEKPATAERHAARVMAMVASVADVVTGAMMVF